MYNILYNPGAGGDMVSAVIDSTDYVCTKTYVRPAENSLRQEFKLKIIKNYSSQGINILYNNFNKTEYMKEIEKKYIAATFSHDFSIQLQHITDTILIDDSEYKYAKWCMERCHIIHPKFHPAFSEEEIKVRTHRVNHVKKYGNNIKIIPFKDVIEGRLIEKLQQWIDTPLNAEIYNHWLNIIIATLPKVD
jgi:hypothetical protein